MSGSPLNRVPSLPLTVRFFPILLDPQPEEARNDRVDGGIGTMAPLRLRLHVQTPVQDAVPSAEAGVDLPRPRLLTQA